MCKNCGTETIFFRENLYGSVKISCLQIGPQRNECYFTRRPQNVARISNKKQIPFQNFDRILKERLYEMAFPTIKNALWIASKSSANLGKKPVVYLASRLNCKQKSFPCRIFKDSVIRCIFSIQFYECFEDDLRNTMKFVQFIGPHLRFESCGMNLIQIHDFCHTNVTRLYLDSFAFGEKASRFDFETVLKLMPKLEELMFYDSLPQNWEEQLLNWNNTKLVRCGLKPKQITDFESLRRLLLQHPRKYFLEISNISEFSEIEFKRNFQLEKNYSRPRCLFCYKSKNYEPRSIPYSIIRRKDSSEGLNNYSWEVEEVMDNMEIVKESAVVVVPHPDFDEVFVAVVVKSCLAEKMDDEEFKEKIVAECEKELTNYKIPKKIFVVEKLLRLVGKIQRNRLQKEYKDLFNKK